MRNKIVRHIDDVDGMWADLQSFYAAIPHNELVDLIMDAAHDNQNHNSFLEDWAALCNGEVVGGESDSYDR